MQQTFGSMARNLIRGLVVLLLPLVAGVHGVSAQSIAFKQAVATAAAKDKALAQFYRARNFAPLWTGYSDVARRRAFLAAARQAGRQGLPVGRYDAAGLRSALGQIGSDRARGLLEVAFSAHFLQYAQDIQSGILKPRRLGAEFYVKPPRRDRLAVIEAFAKSSPRAFLRALAPQTPAYQRLLKEKARLEKVVGRGGWGPKVAARKLRPGRKGPAVVALRKRLSAMDYRGLGISSSYDASLQEAVQLFQMDHGLNADGVAGQGTLKALNVSAAKRLQQVIVGLERQRWLNKPLGARHIMVNLADFRASVMDNGKPTLTTRVVVGRTGKDYRTPEFEKKMTHLIVNPVWHVPESIALREYLPRLQSDPNALSRLGIQISDQEGQFVDPTSIDYTQYGKGNFPFDLQQPPGAGNALGRVKFMFPNRFNIYLHDTPSKSLFGRDQRTYSHGCVRVQKPFELAYTLLARQTSDPKGVFRRALNSGVETQIDLITPVPVYLTYQTVWVTPQGRPNYRMDPYGRDRKVFSALQKAGVSLAAARG